MRSFEKKIFLLLLFSKSLIYKYIIVYNILIIKKKKFYLITIIALIKELSCKSFCFKLSMTKQMSTL